MLQPLGIKSAQQHRIPPKKDEQLLMLSHIPAALGESASSGCWEAHSLVSTSPSPGSKPRSLQKKWLIKGAPAREMLSKGPAGQGLMPELAQMRPPKHQVLETGWLSHLPPPEGTTYDCAPMGKSNQTPKGQVSPTTVVGCCCWIPADPTVSQEGPPDKANCD